ncbi:MAG TPA: DinB family protein [Streptosporangiaceae bacterium]
MNWIAPEVTRISEPLVADERTMLEGWLDWHRATLLWKCAGLPGEQLARRAVPPSNLSLLGLVRHMAEVERSWFRRRFGREQVSFLYSSDDSPDADFDDVTPESAEADFAAYGREVELARAAAAGHSLEETFFHPRRAAEMGLRWVFVHMIEEYARHNGHADLIRERIDGTTGA